MQLLDGWLPVTSPRRTAIDTLMTMTPQAAESLWPWLATRRIIQRRDLLHAVRLRSGSPGVPTLLHLARISRMGAVNGGEKRFHDLLIAAGLLGWEANVPIERDGRVIATVDVLFRRARLAVEFDGFGAHGGRAAFVADRRRHNQLTLAGYRVLRVTWDDLVQRPDEIVAEVRAMLG